MTLLSVLEAAVLVAVAKGIDTLKGLEQLINIDRESLERIVRQLVAKGFLSIEVKGLIFRRPVFRLTEKGLEHVKVAEEILMNISKKLETVKESSFKPKEELLQNFISEVIPLLPLLTWMNIIDVSILSYLIANATEATLIEDDMELGESLDDELDEDIDSMDSDYLL